MLDGTVDGTGVRSVCSSQMDTEDGTDVDFSLALVFCFEGTESCVNTGAALDCLFHGFSVCGVVFSSGAVISVPEEMRAQGYPYS